jgi:pilus assembly protein TadC
MVWAVLAALCAGLAMMAWRPPPLHRLRDRAGPSASTDAQEQKRRILAAGVALGGACVLSGLGWWAAPVGAAVGVGAYLMSGKVLRASTVRRHERMIADLPQACDLLAVCLESGLPMRGSAEVVSQFLAGPVGEVLSQLSAKVRLGQDESQAWAELVRAEPALAALGREVARTVGSGVALAQTLRLLGVDARRDALAAAEVRAKRVGVRSVLPLMVCFLPSFLLLGVVPIIGGVAANLLP